jgi:spermidine synthase
VFDDPRLEVVIDERLRFLRNTNRTYDAINLDLLYPVYGGP